ncbi:flagellar protein FlgJ [Tamilnaduibacter salinus]|uniref:Peptidoglycan hydrolase FlgJ n=1 Tax=Tamilnaduibacter salinus TaxID=1484056 RepID=A0A2U1CV01_9GAMM|nr:flagellar assembly peptidoglycan hydrolase FlgJ [Tamilnaduibacter salinus]PVY75287.1 flagellar protein FlgJ [Tamilnaduibacter salinus]
MQDPRLEQASVYTDLNGLNAIKRQANTDRRAALEQVAKQFEGLFLSEMMKSMRKVNDVFAEGNYLNSHQGEMYQDMFDKQLTLSMSDSGRFGLADSLVRQLSKQVPGMDASGEKRSTHKGSIADYSRDLPSLTPSLPEKVEQVDVMMKRDAVPEERADQPLPKRFESPEQFVESLMPLAKKVTADSDVNPQVMVAQAALETGWGRHMIEGRAEQPSHNLFGIKADNRWQGPSVGITTTEYREGVPMKEQAQFRAYPDFEASFRDYLGFLENNPRYREALNSADRPDVFAQRLQEAGYATDPAYSDKIQRIMGSDPFRAVTGDSLSRVSADPASGERE